jgi:hypothetical protein
MKRADPWRVRAFAHTTPAPTLSNAVTKTVPKSRKHRGRHRLVYHPHPEPPKERRALLYGVLALVLIYAAHWVTGNGWHRVWAEQLKSHAHFLGMK